MEGQEYLNLSGFDRITQVAPGIIFGFLGLLYASEAIRVSIGDISGYPFGWDGGGIAYSTPAAYVMVTGVNALVSLGIVGTALLRRIPATFYLLLVWCLVQMGEVAVDYFAHGLVPFGD